MSTQSPSQTKYFRTIFVPGLYSLQGVSITSGAPDVTMYREDLDALIGDDRHSQMSKLKSQRRFSHFVLSHSKDRADFYDGRGRLIKDEAAKPKSYPTCMSAQPIRCDNDALAKQVSWLLPQPTVCGSFEAHSGQSAAQRSNFYTMLDQMINLAKSDKDREHIFVLSHHSPCPRSVLAADLTKVSDRAQGVFLDYFRRLQKGWPLSTSHHKTELARTFASCRYSELRRWLRAVRMMRDPREDADRLDLMLAGLPLAPRLALARALIEEVYGRFQVMSTGPEHLEELEVLSRADTIGAKMDQLLAMPLSNS